MDHLGDEREGGIGAGGSPDGSWWRWPAALILIGGLCREWKRRILGFV